MNGAMNIFRWKDKGTGEVRTLEVLGHRMLVRRCVKDEADYLVGSPSSAAPPPAFCAEDAAILENLCDNTDQNWCEVLAVGPKCGTRRADREYEKFRVTDPDRHRGARHWERGRCYAEPRTLHNPARPGDLVVLPEKSLYGGMWNHVTGNLFDILVDEAEVVCLLPQEAYA